METYEVQKIGRFRVKEAGACIELEPEYAAALSGLEGFSHLQVLWWFSKCDDEKSRSARQEVSPYKQGPGTLGTFATRSPMRPNPIALSCVQLVHIDAEKVVVWVAYTDAEDGSPVLDIKPYTASLDRVETPATPSWCSHWPQSIEASGVFDWSAEFHF